MNTPTTPNTLQKHFEANMLDGDSLKDCGNAMLAAEDVFEYMQVQITQAERQAELKGAIDEADKIYTNADDLACHGGSNSSIIRSIASRKRALEEQLRTLQENQANE